MLEKKYEKHDKQLKIVFGAIRQMLNPPVSKKRSIGFTVPAGKKASSV